MNLHHTTLGVFVPGKWTVPQNPITGGMGEFVPAAFAVPQNDIVGAGLAGLNEFVPAHFTIPQNPITGLAGLGCGCGGGCRKDGMSGISDDLSGAFDSVSSTVSGALGGISSTTLMWAAAGVAVLFMLTSRGKGASSYRSARSEALTRVRAQYPTVAGRARRAVAAF